MQQNLHNTQLHQNHSQCTVGESILPGFIIFQSKLLIKSTTKARLTAHLLKLFQIRFPSRGHIILRWRSESSVRGRSLSLLLFLRGRSRTIDGHQIEDGRHFRTRRSCLRGRGLEGRSLTPIDCVLLTMLEQFGVRDELVQSAVIIEWNGH